MDAVRRANATRRPEDSVALRGAVLAAVMTGAAALVIESAISVPTGVLVLAALPLAYWVSYRRREKDNWHIKVLLTIGALFALVRFLGQLRGIVTLDEVRFPLADLFLWVQVLHSFDLPARKDLNFSLGSSLTLVSVAGSISQDVKLIPLLGVYLVAVVIALALSYRSQVAERVAGWARVRGETGAATGRGKVPVWDLGKALSVTALVGVGLFLVIPQPSGIRTFALPFNVGSGLGAFAAGGVANPGFDGSPGTRASASSFYAFSGRMDLSVRGDLSDALVMRVRSSAPAMWRAFIFDTYDGEAWTGDQGDARSLGESPPFPYPVEFRSLGPRATVSQTFYVEAEQASAIFAAGQPDLVYFEGGLSIDDNGGLRTASTLTPGTVYSVVSSRGAASPRELRSLPDDDVPETMERYLQLPDDLPSRVHDLARQITADARTDYDRVLAIESYLRENYRYTINSPVPPAGQDAVDHFLFDTDLGFCEQFASATAVLLRSIGIPARVVAGYTPGDRNAFTGYYEVKGSDAHSWVEVWFPRFGWYEFDPTFDVPPATLELAELVPLLKVFRFVAEKVATIVPAGAGGLLRDSLVLALVVAVLAGLVITWRRSRRRALLSGAAPGDPRAGPVTRAFARFETSLFRRGLPRRPSETAAELLARTAALGRPEVGDALQAFQQERYGVDPPPPPLERAAVSELDRLSAAEGGPVRPSSG